MWAMHQRGNVITASFGSAAKTCFHKRMCTLKAYCGIIHR